MIATLASKAWLYVCALGAVIAALAIAVFYGREKGKASMQVKIEQAHAAADAAKATTQQLESRHETDQAIEQLPAAPPQTIADADPATAAGQLRDDGWTRD